MSINANQNVLLIVLIISIVFLIVTIVFARVIKYYIKRKFDSIDDYNKNLVDKLNTYTKNQSQYKQNLEDIGLSNKGIKPIKRIWEFFTHIFKK